MLMGQEELEQAYLIQLILGCLEEVWALGRAQRGEGGMNWQTRSVERQEAAYTMTQEEGTGRTWRDHQLDTNTRARKGDWSVLVSE